MNAPGFFVTGGALQANAGSYVARQADKTLLESLRQREFCYVLTTRQMGKSSLMVRTAAQLRQEGYAVVIIDLTAIGQNLNVEQWYFSMLCHVAEKLELEEEMENYWDANPRRAPLHRFIGALRDVYLATRDKPLIIFVDEIDAVRSLRQFSADEFFAGIRECFNRRTEEPAFQRLTFCLLGVATPSDLISDQRMTPFNIGHAVDLLDFTDDDAAILAGGLSPHRATARALLARVLWWTRGQPFLTQKLCAEVAKGDHEHARDVDEACGRIFFTPEARERDDNLHFVRDRLLRSEQDRAALLDVYGKICRGERVAEDHLNPAIGELRLSGVVRIVDGHLEARNPIYARVFDLKWVRANLPDAESRRLRAAFYRGVRRVAGVALVVLAVMATLLVKIRSSAQSEKAARVKAELAGREAEEAGRREQKAAHKAQQAAEETQRAADRARQSAEGERKANEELLHEAGRTKAALDQIVETQAKVQDLLEALTPFVGDKSGKLILDRAEELVRSATRDAPDDPRAVLGLAGLQRVCSRLYLRLGNDTTAIRHAEEARRLVEAQLHRNGGDLDLTKKQLHDCFVLKGDATLGGRTLDAIKHKTDEDYTNGVAAYEEAMDLAKELYTAHPADGTVRLMYFSDVMTLGDTAKLFGRILDSEKRYREALAAINEWRIATKGGEDFDWIEATAHDRLGTLFLARDRNVDAQTEFDRALALRQAGSGKGHTEDPERQSDLATSYNKLGNVHAHQFQWPEALTYYQRSLTIRRKLCDQSKQKEWQRDLGFSLYNTAHALWKTGDEKGALEMAQERLRHAENMLSEDGTDPLLKQDYANGLYFYADMLLNVKEKELRDWPKALELAQHAATNTERRDPRLLALLAQALRLSKRAPEAKATAEEAAKLLPPPEKRTEEEKDIAKEITFEISKNKSKGKEDPTIHGKRTDTATRAPIGADPASPRM